MQTLEMEAPPKKAGPSPENERMQQVRLALGYKDRTAFSTKVGIERSAYIKMETGPSRPSTESLLKIKAVFKQFNLNFIADADAPILLGEDQLPPAVPSELQPSRPGLPIPGLATPVQADFVGKLISNLEAENARKDGYIDWLQSQLEIALGKPLSSVDAATFMPLPRTPISLRPDACRTEAKVISMYPAVKASMATQEEGEAMAA